MRIIIEYYEGEEKQAKDYLHDFKQLHKDCNGFVVRVCQEVSDRNE